MPSGQNLSEQQLLEKLKLYDTPGVTNVVATYPGNPLCLGLYHPWSQNWYTDQTIKCMYPEIGRLAGYAVTCVYGLSDPNFKSLSFMDVLDEVEKSKKPVILIIKQIFPKEIAGKAGLAGGNMAAALKSLGCLGIISDGPSRDIDEIRPMKFQYMLTGATPGHGDMAVHAINTPVTVGGMDVCPGDIIHMDENGACKFPADKLEAVVKNLEALAKEESERMSALSKAKTAAQLRAIFSGHSYSKQEDKK